MTTWFKIFQKLLGLFQDFLCSFWDVVVVEILPRSANTDYQSVAFNFVSLHTSKSPNGSRDRCHYYHYHHLH